MPIAKYRSRNTKRSYVRRYSTKLKGGGPPATAAAAASIRRNSSQHLPSGENRLRLFKKDLPTLNLTERKIHPNSTFARQTITGANKDNETSFRSPTYFVASTRPAASESRTAMEKYTGMDFKKIFAASADLPQNSKKLTHPASASAAPAAFSRKAVWVHPTASKTNLNNSNTSLPPPDYSTALNNLSPVALAAPVNSLQPYPGSAFASRVTMLSNDSNASPPFPPPAPPAPPANSAAPAASVNSAASARPATLTRPTASRLSGASAASGASAVSAPSARARRLPTPPARPANSAAPAASVNSAASARPATLTRPTASRLSGASAASAPPKRSANSAAPANSAASARPAAFQPSARPAASAASTPPRPPARSAASVASSNESVDESDNKQLIFTDLYDPYNVNSYCNTMFPPILYMVPKSPHIITWNLNEQNEKSITIDELIRGINFIFNTATDINEERDIEKYKTQFNYRSNQTYQIFQKSLQKKVEAPPTTRPRPSTKKYEKTKAQAEAQAEAAESANTLDSKVRTILDRIDKATDKSQLYDIYHKIQKNQEVKDKLFHIIQHKSTDLTQNEKLMREYLQAYPESLFSNLRAQEKAESQGTRLTALQRVTQIALESARAPAAASAEAEELPVAPAPASARGSAKEQKNTRPTAPPNTSARTLASAASAAAAESASAGRERPKAEAEAEAEAEEAESASADAAAEEAETPRHLIAIAIVMRDMYNDGYRFPEWVLDEWDDHDFKSTKVFANIGNFDVNKEYINLVHMVFQREPCNIGMTRYYKQDKFEKVFGWRHGAYDSLTKSQTLMPNIAIYCHATVQNPNNPNEFKKFHVINAVGFAFDSQEQTDYKYFTRNGAVDKNAVIEHYTNMWKLVLASAIVLKREGEIDTIVLANVGGGAFAKSLGGNFINDYFVPSFIRSGIKAQFDSLGINMIGYDFDRNTFKEIRIPRTLFESPEDYNPETTLYVNAWDPWSLIGNGNSSDDSLDGYWGRSSNMSVLGWGITNPYINYFKVSDDTKTKKLKIVSLRNIDLFKKIYKDIRETYISRIKLSGAGQAGGYVKSIKKSKKSKKNKKSKKRTSSKTRKSSHH